MRKPTVLDWLGAAALWAGASGVLGVFLHLGMLQSEQTAVMAGFSTFFAGLGLARWRWLRRASEDGGAEGRPGMSTGEMTAQRLAEMEARIYELEERLELAERLLARAEGRPALPRVPVDTPA